MTDAEFLQFSKINDFIRNKEIHARNMLKPLHQLFEKQLQNKLIDDYFFNYSFSIYPKIIGNEDDDFEPIYSTKMYSLFVDDDEFFEMDWYVHGVIDVEPNQNFHCGYLMHCLIDHTSLTLEEILKIKRVDIDVTVELDY